MPDRAIAGRARRLVVVADHPRRVLGKTPLRRISKKHRPGEEYPHRAAAHVGGARHPDDGARLRRQRLSGISADPERARDISGAGRAAAVERGIFLRWRWLPHPAGRSRQRPTGAKTRTPRGGWPVARHWRYRSAAEFRRQTPPARSGLSDASLTFKTNCVCGAAGYAPALPSAPFRAGERAFRGYGAAP